MSNEISISMDRTAMPSSSGMTNHHEQQQQYQHQQYQQQQQQAGGKGAVSKNAVTPQSPAMRPEDLSVTPWYLEDYPATTDTSPGPIGDRSSYPSYSYADRDGRLDLNGSTWNSSIESEFSKIVPPLSQPPLAPVPRKAYMDLRDAMALLDETCPNVEPSPSLTPRTPRTPLTPYSRSRARSKSSDNSSNYSNDRLSDRSFEVTKDKEKEKEKKRPFLRKIGISKTEDRPFFAKLAPRIIGKPYLEKIGPSKAVERPFLDKIGSSKTLDKFIFDTPRIERKNERKNETRMNNVVKNDIRHEQIEKNAEARKVISMEEVRRKSSETQQATAATCARRRSGKEFLLKMYSFETEDLESTMPVKEHRDPLRGSSLDDVLDSGPTSLPTDNDEEPVPRPESENQNQRPIRVAGAELLKCRVTTSEEIIYSAACLDSPGEINSWSNSPRRARMRKEFTTPVRRRIIRNSREAFFNDHSTPNSPTKRPISSISPDREFRSNILERAMFSPTKTRKSTVDDAKRFENRSGRSVKYNQFERRGISSDNLLAKDVPSFVTAARNISDNIGRTREISSEDSLVARRGVQEYTRETFKQLQDKFRLQEIPTESYADFKRRTRAAQGTMSRHEKMKMDLLPTGFDMESLKIASKTKDIKADAKDIKADATASETTEIKRDRSQEGKVKRQSVLRKQKRIDQPNEQESDANSSIRRPKRRIVPELSQETMDLLSELRKVKSLLRTPSWDKLDLDLEKPTRVPKRILLTDKEFCLSVERENSVRRPSRIINSLSAEEGKTITNQRKQKDQENRRDNEKTGKPAADKKSAGPALFEKRCLSLDYADEEKPQKPEARAISLASTRNLPSETDNYPGPTLICDSKSYSSDVFNFPSEETETNKKNEIGEPEKKEKETETETEKEPPKKLTQNHCAEVDIAIPIDQKVKNPKGDIQGRTSDLYEIISPRSTPFRVKKRLGKISVEETVKPENFTLGSKVDCRSVVVQKRTKCFPL